MRHVTPWAVLVSLTVGAGGPRPVVRPGLDVLLDDSLHLIQGRRVGLVTNYAGVDRSGVHAVERLRSAGVQLVALFSPEHGFRGAADPGEAVASTVDSATGLPIYSLYGRTSAPTDTMLAGIDVMLLDLPDVGSRYYTYLATTVEVMRAAGRVRKQVLILDRPDPIGDLVQGSMMDPAYRSSIGRVTVPMRYGMTLGELAGLARDELNIDVDLRVVPVSGWRRRDDVLTTGLPFLAPSPNLKDPESLFHYAGTCLFEGTALSVGRGTDAPFSQIGAPWLEPDRVIAQARRAGLPGVTLAAATFRPERPGDGKFPGQQVPAIRFKLTDPRRYDPTRTAVVLLTTLQALYPDKLGFTAPHFDRLAGGPRVREMVLKGASARLIVAGWAADLVKFRERRKPFLLYR
ncbi:MAG: DUF1343 domain-containing protein [Gemmatimonadota bacterium]